MSERTTGPATDGERSESLARAVDLLDMIDQRVAEHCSAPVLQDVVGNLLLIVARISQAGDTDGLRDADILAECRALALESLEIAGLSGAGIDQAVSAVAYVDRLADTKPPKSG